VTSEDQITENLTVDLPSENLDLFDLLPLRQLVVFVVRAHHRPMTELAELLGLSRQSVHTDLRSAIRTLSERGAPAPERPDARPGRPYRCATHGGDCPAQCRHLRRWLAAFDDRAKPATR
jgi:hypothetical protein